MDQKGLAASAPDLKKTFHTKKQRNDDAPVEALRCGVRSAQCADPTISRLALAYVADPAAIERAIDIDRSLLPLVSPRE